MRLAASGESSDMIRPSNELRAIYVCVKPVDFRLQINGLSLLVQESLQLDPFSEQLYCFTNRRRNRVKILVWECSGFVMWQKRLERERFHWPVDEASTVSLSGQELNWLLDGFDLTKWRPHRRLHYQYAA